MGEGAVVKSNIDRVRQKFLKKLHEYIPLFESFKSALKNSDFKNVELEDVRMSFHKIHGSAKIFGYPEYGELASRLEGFLNELLENKDNIPVDLKGEFEKFLKTAYEMLESGINLDEVGTVLEEKDPEYYDYSLMIIDDDSLISELLKEGFQKEKCDIIQLLNGKEIDEVIKNIHANPDYIKPDLIILDVNMPGMNGFEVLKKLKESQKSSSIPVIMVTGSDEDENVIKGLSYGALDYITKPFEASKLVSRIMKTIKRHKIKILVADDDPLIRDLLQQRFYSMGYKVLVSANGKEALDCMKSDVPDIVVLDIMMPGMDGMAILKQIKQDPITENIPVIFLTAKNQQENILDGLESGANDYITKPFDVNELVARVVGTLGRIKDA